MLSGKWGIKLFKEQACSTCVSFGFFAERYDWRETERLWENWLITKTAFPSPRCDMFCARHVGSQLVETLNKFLSSPDSPAKVSSPAKKLTFHKKSTPASKTKSTPKKTPMNFVDATEQGGDDDMDDCIPGSIESDDSDDDSDIGADIDGRAKHAHVRTPFLIIAGFIGLENAHELLTHAQLGLTCLEGRCEWLLLKRQRVKIMRENENESER